MFLLTDGVTTKQGASVGIALSGALAVRVICFGENDVNPRPIRAGRIEGPGRGQGEGSLPVTMPKPPVAQRAGGICRCSFGYVCMYVYIYIYIYMCTE